MKITALEYAAPHLGDWSPKTGMPGVILFAKAVQVWAVAQDRYVTAGEIAAVFNVPKAIVDQVFERCPWIQTGAGAHIMPHRAELAEGSLKKLAEVYDAIMLHAGEVAPLPVDTENAQ